MKRLLILGLLLLLLAGCKKDSPPTLQQDDAGYDLTAFLDQPEDVVISQLQEAGVQLEPNEAILNEKYTSYKYTETINGLDFEVTLGFWIYGDASENRLANYTKDLFLTEWPEGETAQAIQKVYDAMYVRYGEPNDSNSLDPSAVCDTVATKSAGWNTAHYTWRQFEITHKPGDYMGPGWADYEAMVRISDISVEARAEQLE